MGQLDRIIFVAGGTVANTVLLLLWIRVVFPLLSQADAAGSTFSGVVDLLGVIPGVAIGLIYLGLAAFAVAGPVQEETAASRRSRTEVRRRR